MARQPTPHRDAPPKVEGVESQARSITIRVRRDESGKGMTESVSAEMLMRFLKKAGAFRDGVEYSLDVLPPQTVVHDGDEYDISRFRVTVNLPDEGPTPP